MYQKSNLNITHALTFVWYDISKKQAILHTKIMPRSNDLCLIECKHDLLIDAAALSCSFLMVKLFKTHFVRVTLKTQEEHALAETWTKGPQWICCQAMPAALPAVIPRRLWSVPSLLMAHTSCSIHDTCLKGNSQSEIKYWTLQ